MLSLSCLLLTSAILFCIIKFRVHVRIHVDYSRPTSRVGATRKGDTAFSSEPVSPQGSRLTRKPGRRAESIDDRVCSTATTGPDSVVWGDITSALVNLGASKMDARSAAKKALLDHAQESFDIQLSAALQNIGRAA